MAACLSSWLRKVSGGMRGVGAVSLSRCVTCCSAVSTMSVMSSGMNLTTMEVSLGGGGWVDHSHMGNQLKLAANTYTTGVCVVCVCVCVCVCCS